jgi:hypothetical protein
VSAQKRMMRGGSGVVEATKLDGCPAGYFENAV